MAHRAIAIQHNQDSAVSPMLEFVDQGSRRKDGPKMPRQNVSPAASLMARAHALRAELLLPYWFSPSVLQHDQRFSVLA